MLIRISSGDPVIKYSGIPPPKNIVIFSSSIPSAFSDQFGKFVEISEELLTGSVARNILGKEHFITDCDLTEEQVYAIARMMKECSCKNSRVGHLFSLSSRFRCMSMSFEGLEGGSDVESINFMLLAH